MRFAAATIALLLAVASATFVPNVNEANLDREPESRTIVNLGFLQAHKTRNINIANVVIARASDNVENSLERRTPNFIFAGFEDVSTGVERSP
ncbi:hypothetical protein CPAR01_09914 [Colletotrichum paranaense]|uniref:RxLR effector protein n=1 Tax=Colletotrichum paranaense TaxID=1914294 RepID=A0ABQ9SCR9_9PEZI|nr:uncharacterized protein CPAR01_09914 [Colletotrichum paranaense]KAK1533206.1 hypothetical protein CPAR01_09914 [Colletotrichum paranaense]